MSDNRDLSKKDLYEKVGHDNPRARRLMWAGIIIFSVAICGIWGWSLKEQIAAVKWSETPESKLVKKAQSDWNKLFEEQKVTEEKNNLKNAIHAVLESAHPATSTVSSTTTTTTIETTSTLSSTATKK